MNSNDVVVEWVPADLLEIQLNEPDDFLKVRETLSRIGVASKREQKTLFQSCHILHKQGRYSIVHFKELFLLDGKAADFTEDDRARRNTIAVLLADWGLLSLVNPEKAQPRASLKQIKILSHKEKGEWDLQVKYQIGNVHGKKRQ